MEPGEQWVRERNVAGMHRTTSQVWIPGRARGCGVCVCVVWRGVVVCVLEDGLPGRWTGTAARGTALTHAQTVM